MYDSNPKKERKKKTRKNTILAYIKEKKKESEKVKCGHKESCRYLSCQEPRLFQLKYTFTSS